jgi:hypothetical protein
MVELEQSKKDEQPFPIEYNADFIMPTVDIKKHFTLLNERLAKTNDMSLFQTGYIQRYIDFQWDSHLRWVYGSVLLSHVICCIFIMVNISLLDYPEGSKANRFKWYFTCANGIIVLITVPFFEI